MTSSSDWRRFTQVLLGACLVAAPLFFLVGGVVQSPVYDGDDFARYLASIADHETAYYAGGMLMTIGAFLLVGVVIALVHLIRVRHPRFAMAAGALGLLGAIGIAGGLMASTIVEFQMAGSGNRAAMAALLSSGEDATSSIPFFVVWIGIAVAMLMLAGGLVWSKTVPMWMAACVAIGMISVFFVSGDIPGLIASAVFLLGLASIGVAVIRSPLEEWEAGDLTHHAPTPTPQAPIAAAP